jgi:hypothetical protein
VSAVSKEASADLDAETRALHELLALERRLEEVATRAIRRSCRLVTDAFKTATTRRFRGPWSRAMDAADHMAALKVIRQAIGALSRHMASQARAQHTLIARLRTTPAYAAGVQPDSGALRPLRRYDEARNRLGAAVRVHGVRSAGP